MKHTEMLDACTHQRYFSCQWKGNDGATPDDDPNHLPHVTENFYSIYKPYCCPIRHPSPDWVWLWIGVCVSQHLEYVIIITVIITIIITIITVINILHLLSSSSPPFPRSGQLDQEIHDYACVYSVLLKYI